MKYIVYLILILGAASAAGKKKPKAPPPSPLEQYVAESKARQAAAPPPAPGSLWTPGSRFADSARDPRASMVDDIVTILVVESASAVTSGTTKTSRVSSTNNSISALAGITKAAGPWANLTGVKGDTELNGQGTTSRGVTINTTMTARVAAVLPNGGMVVEASKDVEINTERQIITVRGVVRPTDLLADNTVRSDRLAQLEVKVNGKGVVGDAIRRPNALYRLILGLLPF